MLNMLNLRNGHAVLSILGVKGHNITSAEVRLANKGGVNSEMSLVNVMNLSKIRTDYHVLKTFNKCFPTSPSGGGLRALQCVSW